ncbi:MAG: helix-turn-helix transcriptional regulator [Verrucomicrobiales bacterium]|nr:helix-turn-helix transcriptional regulator [Verrucomicrobiales bacterium]
MVHNYSHRETSFSIEKSTLDFQQARVSPPYDVRFSAHDPVALGRSIRLARASGGMSLQDVSRISGVALSNVWKIEAGKGAPSFSTVLAILESVGIPLSYLAADCIRPKRDGIYDAALVQILPRVPEAELPAARAFADWTAACSVLVIYAILSGQTDPITRITYPTDGHKKSLVPALIEISQRTPVMDRIGILENITFEPVTVIQRIGLWTEAMLANHLAWYQSQPAVEGSFPKWVPPLPKLVDSFLHLPPNTSDHDASLLAAIRASRPTGSAGVSAAPNIFSTENSDNSALHYVSEVVNYEPLSPLAQLLHRLKRAAASRGKKTELAEFLGVPLARVSQWLSGDREPGGATTLRLLEWVQAEEAKTPSGAGTPPGEKTRSRKSSNEKPKSNPNEK